MSAVWTAVKKSLDCKSTPSSEVHEPKPKTKTTNSCCKPKSRATVPPLSSSSLSCKSTIRDVIHGSKRIKQSSSSRSPMSIRSSDLINPVTHHVRFTNSDLKNTKDHGHNANGSPSKFYLGSPAPRPRLRNVNKGLDSPSTVSNEPGSSAVSGSSFRSRRLSMAEGELGGEFRQNCHKCGEPLARQDAEEHHLSKHAVTEVLEGDSSRKVIEMIFKAGWIDVENRGRIDKILKVHNPQTKVAQFEEYREMVKIRANKLQHSKKHPRLLADGNELLRFYGTTIACSLGKKGSSSLCTLQRCNVCCILRHGFLHSEGTSNSIMGIFTTSTSERAYRSIDTDVEEKENHRNSLKKALIVCRVIAGRVHRPMLENIQEFVGGRRSGFDSLAGKLGSNNSHVEELFLLKSTALLPCFVIICKL
ncbi:uncharacterized protein LOC110693740 [Chenopodium quinoa]|uniref:uncharacterized protein LOC110693740 n=1 Tax=Chenopodium quinoa TaxID=63459 RepID=UPI000B7820AA|nr:uncharacterized protein LOC110693740 [Chenopodium quinoa]